MLRRTLPTAQMLPTALMLSGMHQTARMLPTAPMLPEMHQTAQMLPTVRMLPRMHQTAQMLPTVRMLPETAEDVLIKTVSVILPTKEILPAVEMGVIKMQVKIPIQATRMTLHD